MSKTEIYKLKHQQVLENIIKRRKELGFSQFELSYKLKLTEDGYFKIETGRVKLDVKRLFQIARVLKIDPRELIELPKN